MDKKKNKILKRVGIGVLIFFGICVVYGILNPTVNLHDYTGLSASEAKQRIQDAKICDNIKTPELHFVSGGNSVADNELSGYIVDELKIITDSNDNHEYYSKQDCKPINVIIHKSDETLAKEKAAKEKAEAEVEAEEKAEAEAKKIEVPNFVGQFDDVACAKAKELGFVIGFDDVVLETNNISTGCSDYNNWDGKGNFAPDNERYTVRSQSPYAGKRVVKGTRIKFMVKSAEIELESVERETKKLAPDILPDLLGKRADLAKENLADAGWIVDFVSVDPNAKHVVNASNWVVVAMSPFPGEKVDKNTLIKLFVEKGAGY